MDTPFTVIEFGEFTIVEFQVSSLMNPNELERISAALHLLFTDRFNGRLIVDFACVEFISSQAIGIIMSLNKKVSQIKGGKLILCGVGPQLMQVLKITRLDRLLKIAKNQKDAVK